MWVRVTGVGEKRAYLSHSQSATRCENNFVMPFPERLPQCSSKAKLFGYLARNLMLSFSCRSSCCRIYEGRIASEAIGSIPCLRGDINPTYTRSPQQQLLTLPQPWANSHDLDPGALLATAFNTSSLGFSPDLARVRKPASQLLCLVLN